MPLEARPSGLIIAPKRSGTNFVHDVLAPAYHSAVNEPLGLHNEVPGDNQNPLSPWNFSGAEHASAEFGHTALADDPFGSLVTRSFLYWLSEGNQLIKETDFLYLGWLLASAKLKVVSIYRDPRQSIASYRKHDLFHKWQFKSKLTHFFDTINTTPVLDTLYGGLSSFRSLAKTADHHQLAVYYAIAIHEIKRNTQGFDSFETSYDDLVYHSEATFQKLANYLQIPWTEQLQTAIRIRTSTTRDVGAHGTFRHSSDLSHFSQILSLPEITDIQAIFKELGISLQESQPVVVPQILGPKPDRVETPSVLVTQANREAASTAILQDAVLVDVEKPLLIASKLITNLQYSEFLCWLQQHQIPLFLNGKPLFCNDRPQAKVHVVDGVINVEKKYGHHPVTFISWIAAAAYCAWVGGRLPSETEWRTGINEAEIDETTANLGQLRAGTTPVTFFPPSNRGIYDAQGNVSIWIDNGSTDISAYEKMKVGWQWNHTQDRELFPSARPYWLGSAGLGTRPVFDFPQQAISDAEYLNQLGALVDLLTTSQTKTPAQINQEVFTAVQNLGVL